MTLVDDMYDDFDPKDIGKEPKPTIEHLLIESSGIYDEDGKDTTAYWYGKKTPKLAERNRLGHDEKARANISKNHADVSGEKNPMFGKRHTEETRKRMSENRKGMNTRPKSTEHKRKIGLAMTKYWENRRAN